MPRVESKTGTIHGYAGPDTGGAEYIAVCHQAFSPETLKKGAVDGR
jgi:hypothetical protein